MAIQANAQGVIKGKFKIPKGIKAGTKQVTFKGAGASKSNAETTFTGQGTIITNTMRKVNNIQQSYYDPLAQTFIPTEARHVHAVDIWVVKKGSTPLIVQLRETTVGFPTREIVATGTLDVASIQVNAWNKVYFDVPFYTIPNVEYALVVLANDPDMEVGISELGKADLVGKQYVTQQPYQIGVLLSSSNASTWTTHQDKDLTFRLYARRYKGNKSFMLGTVQLNKATDLLVSALTSTPATGADADLELRMPDPADPTKTVVRTVSDGQIVKFDQETSGEMEVWVNLRCTPTASATIEPGSQIIVGTIATTGDYVTRDIPVDKSGASDLTVTLEASTGASVNIFYAENKRNGTKIQPADWKPLTFKAPGGGVSATLDNGRTERRYIVANIPAMGFMKLKVVLGGGAGNRSQIFNLRASLTPMDPNFTKQP